MKINTAFNMGQKVWSVQSLPNEGPSTTCPCCEGAGTMTGKNGEKYYCPCPDCNKGQVFEPAYLYQIVPGTVSRIEVCRQNSLEKTDGCYDESKPVIVTNECYGIAGDRSAVYIEDLFGTQKEAEAECKKRNEQATPFVSFIK